VGEFHNTLSLSHAFLDTRIVVLVLILVCAFRIFFETCYEFVLFLFPSLMEATQPGAVPGEEEAPQKRIKVEVEEETMPTKPEPSSAGDVELSGEVHTILINGFPSASGSCATSARWYARSATSCQQGLCPFKNNVNSIRILTQKLNSK